MNDDEWDELVEAGVQRGLLRRHEDGTVEPTAKGRRILDRIEWSSVKRTQGETEVEDE